MFLKRLKIGFLILIMGTPNAAAGSPSWILFHYKDDGLPVVMKVMEDLPPKQVRERFAWLTVISWRYDATENNGMPIPDVNSQMKQLEASIDTVEENGFCVQVYSRTGKGLSVRPGTL